MGNVSEKMRKWWLSWILFWVLVPIAHAEGNSVRYFQTDERYAFRIALLQQVLDRSSSQCGPFLLQPLSENVTQSRGQQLLEDNAGVDIAFLPTSISRELALRAIKIPILSGILGYRVFLIRASDQTKFASITRLENLQKNYRGGFGSQWADMTILTHNGLNMYGVTNYESLFSMLSVGRFDFFPRGINEAWQELALKKEAYPNLAVEQNIALYYPYPVYFFVHPSNVKLADCVTLGLQQMQADGSYEKLFLAYHNELIKLASLETRRLFVLQNPNVDQTAQDPHRPWWLKHGQNYDQGQEP